MHRSSPLVLIALLLAAVYRTTDQPLVRIGVLLTGACCALALIGWLIARYRSRATGVALVTLGAMIVVVGLFLTADQRPMLRHTYTPDALANAPELVEYRGFYGTETDKVTQDRYAWTQGRATLVLDFLTHRPITLTVEMRGAATAGGPDTPVDVAVNDHAIGQLHPDPRNTSFQSFTFQFVPYDWGGGQTEIKLLTTAFTPGKGDTRMLGTMVKSVTVDKSAAWGSYTRRANLLWAILPLTAIAGVLEWARRRGQSPVAGWGAAFLCVVNAIIAVVLLATLWRIGPLTPGQFRNGILGTALLTLVFTLAALWLALTQPVSRALFRRLRAPRFVVRGRARFQARGETPTVPARGRRTWYGVRGDLALLFIVALAVRLLWALLVPPWLAPDEPDHYIYASHIVEQGLPNPSPSPYPAYPDEYGASANLALVPDLSSGISGRPRPIRYLPVDYDYAVARDYQDPVEARRTSTSSRAFSYPPLYYLLGAIPYKIAYAAPVIARLFAVRLASVVLGALGCVFGYLFAYELRGTRRWGVALGWCMALMPMYVFSNATVNNDAALFCLCTALAWLLARVFGQAERGSRWLVFALGAVAGLIVVTKPTGDGLVAIASALVVVRVLTRWWSEWRVRTRTPGTGERHPRLPSPVLEIAAYALGLALTVAPWSLYHWKYWGEPGVIGTFVNSLARQFFGTATAGTAPNPAHAARTTYSLASYLHFETHRGGEYFHWLLVKTFWGYFGWLDEPMPYRVYIPITIFCVIGLIGCVAQFIFQPARRTPLLLAVILVVVQLLFVILGADYYEGWRQSGQELGLQGRYFLPILAPALFLWLSGWEYLMRDRPFPLRLAPFAMLTVQAVALSTILFTYYGVTFG